MSAKTPDEAAFLSQLGLRVRRARAQAGLTRRRLAEASGVSERYLAQLEAGEGNGSILLIRRVAAALRTGLLELIGPPVDVARHDRIALIGLRGAGKTTLGRRLAERLGCPFVDLRIEAARHLGLPSDATVPPGDTPAWREAERHCLERIAEGRERCVIEVGGSTLLEPPNAQLLRGRFLTVWLKATPEDHLDRVAARQGPLPPQDREAALAGLRLVLAQRQPHYAQCELVLDTSANDEARCLQALVEALGGAQA